MKKILSLPRVQAIADRAIAYEKKNQLISRSLDELNEMLSERCCDLDSDYNLSVALAQLRAICYQLKQQGEGIDYPYDIQLAAAAAIYHGAIIEMGNGEGKTLVGTLAAILRAKQGHSVHISTFNEYLAQRDATWMWPLYHTTNLQTAVVSRDNAFIATGNHHNDVNSVSYQDAYLCDIVYGDKSQLGFDFLRDNIKMSPNRKIQNQLDFLILDEADSTLIDEAKTPLTLTKDRRWAHHRNKIIADSVAMARSLHKEEHFTVKDKIVDLTDAGRDYLESTFSVSLYDDPEILWAEQISNSLYALECLTKGDDYLVIGNEIVLIDSHTSRLNTRSRYNNGVHQALELKEGLMMSRSSEDIAATISMQNFILQYRIISGMTGSIYHNAEEIKNIYSLPVIQIPLHQPSKLEDRKYLTVKTRDGALMTTTKLVANASKSGIPILISVHDTDETKKLSALFDENDITYQVLDASDFENEAMKIKEAGYPGKITITTKYAGRGTDIKINEESRANGGLGVIIVGLRDIREEKQLKGRAGRQGAPGWAVNIISFEDEMMEMFRNQKMLSRILDSTMHPEEVMEHSILNWSIDNAQEKINQYNYKIRNELFKSDRVIFNFRKFIYDFREDVIYGRQNLRHLFELFVSNIVDKHYYQLKQTRSHHTMDQDDRVIDEMCMTFQNIKVGQFKTAKNLRGRNKRKEEITKIICKQIKSQFEDGTEDFNQFFNIATAMFIRTSIDELWSDFLAEANKTRSQSRLQGISTYKHADYMTEKLHPVFMKTIDNIEYEVVLKWDKFTSDPASFENDIYAEFIEIQNKEALHWFTRRMVSLYPDQTIHFYAKTAGILYDRFDDPFGGSDLIRLLIQTQTDTSDINNTAIINSIHLLLNNNPIDFSNVNEAFPLDDSKIAHPVAIMVVHILNEIRYLAFHDHETNIVKDYSSEAVDKLILHIKETAAEETQLQMFFRRFGRSNSPFVQQILAESMKRIRENDLMDALKSYIQFRKTELDYLGYSCYLDIKIENDVASNSTEEENSDEPDDTICEFNP